MLVELIYCSRSVRSFDDEDLEYLLLHTRAKNEAMNITGALIYANCQFLQVIEGERADVNRVFQSISHDARHFAVELLSYRDIVGRNFEAWHMAFVGGKGVKKLAFHESEADFNCANLNGSSALGLLMEQSQLTIPELATSAI